MHISAAGVIGYAAFGYGNRVVLWTAGAPSVLDVFGDWDWPLGIGEAGHVIGWGMYPPPDDTGSHPFVWHDGVAIDIGTLGRQGGITNGVNALGHAVGEFWTRGVVTHAFFWNDESGMIDLGVLPGWAHSKALAVSDTDVVVGECSSFNSRVGTPFIWREGVMSPLPILRDTGTALAINNDGVIVGHNETEGVGQIGVVWIDGQPAAVEDRLATVDAWQITECRDINRAGTILAAGRLDGQPYELLLTPACSGDFNLDRAVDTRDVVAFLGAWAAGDEAADFDENGVLDTRDVTAFLGAWASGCP